MHSLLGYNNGDHKYKPLTVPETPNGDGKSLNGNYVDISTMRSIDTDSIKTALTTGLNDMIPQPIF